MTIYVSPKTKLQFGFPEELRIGHVDRVPDTLKSLWPFLCISKALGMCPISRIGNTIKVYNVSHVTWVCTWLAIILRGFVWGNFTYNSLYKDYVKTSIVRQVNVHIFYTQILLDTVYMAYKAKHIPALIQKFKHVEGLLLELRSSVHYKDNLVHVSYMIIAAMCLARVVGSVIFYCSVFWGKLTLSNVSEFFNSKLYTGGGNLCTGIVFALTLSFNEIAWGYADILLSLLAYLLETLFYRLNTYLSHLAQPTLNDIEKFRRYHREICHLVKLCNDLFSMLVLLTYVGNVACLLTRLYQGVGDDQKHELNIVKIESCYAVFYLVLMKILLPSYLGARLNSEAHRTLCIVQRWSCSVEGPQVKEHLLVIGRFVSDVSAQEIGMSGCGYFIITKKFLVTTVSAIITYEIIILQFQVSSCKAM